MPDDVQELGTCCACGQSGPRVRNIIMIDKKSPTPGKGWGCVQCHLANDGAVAVKCDACLESENPLQWACRGYPGTDGRVPIDELQGVHDHDMTKHPEAAERRCRECGCTEERACEGGCYWVLPDVCSRCAIEQLVRAGIDPAPLLAGVEYSIFAAADEFADGGGAIEAPPLWQPGDPI